ncbi:chromosomal replication initiator protein DnaA [Bacilli bacterium]|nr:chromosomal replication initiator protein DnaA [Bacilli bacterium]
MLVSKNDGKDFVNDGLDWKWSSICDAFQKEFGDDVYNGWISTVSLVSLSEYEVVMSAPTNFVRDWVLREYFNGRYKKVDGEQICLKRGIKQILLDHFPKLVSFDIIVDKNREYSAPRTKNIAMESREETVSNTTSFSEYGGLYSIGTELNKAYTFSNYVVGSSNKLAFEVAKSFASGNRFEMGMNPLFIYGGVGLGKTHLCQAIAWDMKEKNPGKQIIYLSAERFMYLFVQALQNQDMNNFKNRFRNVDVLIVDDIQFITGKDKTQKEFFYTFDTLVNDRKQVVMACDRAPANLESLDEKLKSRMNGGLIVDIKEFDYQLRLDLIRKKSDDLGLVLREDLMEFLAEKINRNCREIEGCLRRLFINQSIMGNRLEKEDIEIILVDNINQSNEAVSIENIQGKVAEYFDISVPDLKSKKRLKNLVLPRHIAMYLSKELTSKSFLDIARKFNGKNHATVIHGINSVKKLMESSSEVSGSISKLISSLK